MPACDFKKRSPHLSKPHNNNFLGFSHVPEILTDSNVVVEPCPVNTSGSSVWKELERVALG
jgi:hypothetical protein